MATVNNSFGSGVVFTAPIDLGAKRPLDSRSTVQSLEDRDAHVSGNRAYPGMTVYVGQDNTTYVYCESNVPGTFEWRALADQAWVTKQITSAGGMNDEQVRSIVREMFQAYEKSGATNDIRTYETISSFPLIFKKDGHYYTVAPAEGYEGELPSEGVEYVDRSTQIEYIWKKAESESSEYTGEYAMLNATATDSDISNIFSI